jgi:hypothetical protein
VLGTPCQWEVGDITGGSSGLKAVLLAFEVVELFCPLSFGKVHQVEKAILRRALVDGKD